ncbi:DUF4412 domain-containing protein [Mucilaginibacter arboris]|uniref:DUF4412 domain-containing protein n=1 Tax=Mucilaginibacter arboris TaxID=2682090 RepID=A0A7K1SXJ2_9SPHI|nr:DUF4412 domain-containing protein [Mucilaginibacter arboris]MVN21957.1 DUF4412 domain-containing protein [Mucilaginibacter arboris]
MINIKKATLGLALTTICFAAHAQKNYTEGVITYSVSANGQQTESKTYFKNDSTATKMQQGPATISILSNDKGNYMVVLIDVPVASMKKAAVATPADLEQMKDQEPSFTSTPTTETQTISGYKCKKVKVKDSKSGSTFDAWITNDITAPSNNLTKFFTNMGGYPIKFTTIQRGQPVEVTLKSISDEKVKPGTFAIPADFDRITFEDLKALGGGKG